MTEFNHLPTHVLLVPLAVALVALPLVPLTTHARESLLPWAAAMFVAAVVVAVVAVAVAVVQVYRIGDSGEQAAWSGVLAK